MESKDLPDEWRAACETNQVTEDGNGKICNIFYSKNWMDDNELGAEEIKRVAFHEVCELLLSDLRSYAENKIYMVSDREVDNAVHSIIQLLANKVMDKI
jgi:hypothetical protein